MATTIQLGEKTLRLLKRLKVELKLRSYEAVIKHLVSEKEQIPDSLFGANPDLKPYNRETDRMKFHDEE
ncbi:MAG: hypothetical protein HYV03_04055 [Deltaproteobacteria bacterium]|nr:hypothetical protein [Deltaproteobacteria bacterium]